MMLLNPVEVFGFEKNPAYENNCRKIDLISIFFVLLLDYYASNNSFTKVANNQAGKNFHPFSCAWARML